MVNSDVARDDHESPRPDLTALDEALGNPPVIAIGNNAALRLEIARVPYMERILHPAFVKRFHSRIPRQVYGERLTRMIKDAIEE
jgi:hypothetical protein